MYFVVCERREPAPAERAIVVVNDVLELDLDVIEAAAVWSRPLFKACCAQFGVSSTVELDIIDSEVLSVL